MKSKVYFINFRASAKENILEKIGRLVDTAGISEIVKDRDLTAIKIHFGEYGNTAFIRPVFVRKIIECIKDIGGRPFLTDTNTLYSGSRGDTYNHLVTAFKNGFTYTTVSAPIVIADGLRGGSETPVTIKKNRFKKVYIGSEIYNADSLISVAHFKGHELSGFAGTLKNLGMGCASRKGKMAQHAGLGPRITKKKCIGCGECVYHCSQNALSMVDEKAKIDLKKCIGCGECILICVNDAINVRWKRAVPVFLENMIEYTLGVLHNKKGKSLFINFITDVSPGCDCHSTNDAPIVRDIGILASKDPVAVDRASVDLVNKEQALPETRLRKNRNPGEDKFKGIYPKVNWESQFEYAEKLGIGNIAYKMIRI